MAAYPFQKMTNRQLRRLLQDDEEQDRRLKQSPACSVTNPPAIHSIRINPAAPHHPEMASDAR